MKRRTAQLVLGAALLAPAFAFGQAYSEGLINIPGAVPQAYGIDDDDQVVGYFYDSQNVSHGFVLSGGVVAQIDQPGGVSSVAFGINSTTGIVGYYATSASTTAGMLDAKLRFPVVKGSSEKLITGINATGAFVGWNQSTRKGFINTNGVYTNVLPSPCMSLPKPVDVYVLGVNAAGDLVGSCYDGRGGSVGFARVGGVDQTVQVFGRRTYPTGINDSGTIAGWFVDASGVDHGFIVSGGNPTQFDFVGSTAGTAIQGINNRGSVAGITVDSNTSQWVSFFAFAN